MDELPLWLATFKSRLDETSYNLILETLRANQFASRLQLKLLTSDQIDLMFANELSLGAKTLLLFQLDLLKEESPLPTRQIRRNLSELPDKSNLEGDETHAPARRVGDLMFYISCI